MMSARNYPSAKDRGLSKILDTLPNIKPQKIGYRNNQEFSSLTSSQGGKINRNVNFNYSYAAPNYGYSFQERAGTPFSDFFSESETGTPDFHSEESDSSVGSALYRSTAEATKILADEWERIERTLYDEEGEKTTRPQMIEECEQWKQLHPQLRVVGKALPVPGKRLSCRQMDQEEVIAMQYSDYEGFSESEERLSQSSSDVTPQNSPRPSIDAFEPKLFREKVSFYPMFDDADLPETFHSLLQITPMQINSPVQKKRQNSSILKSEINSSRWMKNNRPESSVHCDRNSAKSFVSVDPVSLGELTSDRNKYSQRVVTARQRELARLEPLYTPEVPLNESGRILNINPNSYARKVSLPPLLIEEEKRRSVSSAKKHNLKYRKTQKGTYNLDKVKQSKTNTSK